MSFRGQDFALDSPAAAVAALLERFRTSPGFSPRAAQPLALDLARGRILALPVACDRDSPAFDYAAMDGYVVRAAELRAAAASARQSGETTVTLRVVGEARIGQTPPRLPPSEPGAALALRIATGAPIAAPGDAHGAVDAVVKREDVIEQGPNDGSCPQRVSLTAESALRISPGDHIRHRAENARAGDQVLRAGQVLTPAALGALAAVGHFIPSVFTPLRVALVTTGDELVPPHLSPGPFQIRNSNLPSIAAILAAQPWLHLAYAASLHDDADLPAALRALMRPPIQAEAIILSGGVSMGHRDPVRAAVETLGASIIFHGLPQRPGKPLLAAALPAAPGRDLPTFGLPGNPVSAMVTATRIVLPVLAACAGAAATPSSLVPRLVRLADGDGQRLNLWWHRLASLQADDQGHAVARLVDSRGSGDLISAARSDGFLEVPPADFSGSSPPCSDLLPFYSWPL